MCRFPRDLMSSVPGARLALSRCCETEAFHVELSHQCRFRPTTHCSFPDGQLMCLVPEGAYSISLPALLWSRAEIGMHVSATKCLIVVR